MEGAEHFQQERAVSERRDLGIVSDQGSHAWFFSLSLSLVFFFFKKHGPSRHPKIPYILVPPLGWRKLFTLSISHC